jgi:hypothetical protein
MIGVERGIFAVEWGVLRVLLVEEVSELPLKSSLFSEKISRIMLLIEMKKNVKLYNGLVPYILTPVELRT